MKATKGTCPYCSKEYARAGMAKHLLKCLAEQAATGKSEKSPCLLLQVSARYIPDYWLQLQADASTTLRSLDTFLRGIWLECCGHMSVFHIGPQDVGMSRKLNSFLEPGDEIDYDYDMGDTTSLRIKVVGQYQGVVKSRKPVELLVRNQAPVFTCDECGKEPAITICQSCLMNGEEGALLCKSCQSRHECGNEYSLPLVNSPRTGVCGYTG